MPDTAVIRHALGFALRLVDTTTGRPADVTGIRVLRDGRLSEPLFRPDGTLVFLADGERKDEELTIQLPGYEKRITPLRFAELDAREPLLELHMIPSAGRGGVFRCHTIAGKMEGLVSIDAVRSGESPCLAREFDPRKKILTVLNPHKLALDAIYYAIVDPDGAAFEAIEIKKKLGEQEYKLAAPLQKEFRNHFPVCRRVFGLADADGSYLLRVPADRDNAVWLVRFVFPDREEFESVACGSGK